MVPTPTSPPDIIILPVFESPRVKDCLAVVAIVGVPYKVNAPETEAVDWAVRAPVRVVAPELVREETVVSAKLATPEVLT